MFYWPEKEFMPLNYSDSWIGNVTRNVTLSLTVPENISLGDNAECRFLGYKWAAAYEGMTGPAEPNDESFGIGWFEVKNHGDFLEFITDVEAPEEQEQQEQGEQPTGTGGAGGAGAGGGGGAARGTTATHTVSVCGNGICEAGEDEVCPADCMVSGNEQEKSSEEKITEAAEGKKESEKELEKASTDVSTGSAITGAFINITKEQGIGMLVAAIAIIATLIVLLRKKLF